MPAAFLPMIASLRPVGAQSQRLAAGEDGGTRRNAADPAFADNHHCPSMARIVTRRPFEALDGDDFHGRKKFPLPRAFLADGMAFLSNQPADGQRDRANRRRAESQRRKKIARVETEIDEHGQNPSQHGVRKHEQRQIATRGECHGRLVSKKCGDSRADHDAMK